MIFLPATSADDWKRGLADPDRQWVAGYSAHALANCWHQAAGLPAEVRRALEGALELRGLEPLLVLPEHRVALPGGTRPSQTDVWVLARTSGALVSIAVEGKVSETFGPTVRDWLNEASDGKVERLTYLRRLLGLSEEVTLPLRYQLLHRAASAIIEAERFHARHAVLLVHSFSQSAMWFGDFAAFASAVGASAEHNQLAAAHIPGEVRLFVGWVEGDPRFLAPRPHEAA